MTVVVTCVSCGAKITPSDSFCYSCGIKIGEWLLQLKLTEQFHVQVQTFLGYSSGLLIINKFQTKQCLGFFKSLTKYIVNSWFMELLNPPVLVQSLGDAIPLSHLSAGHLN